MAFFLTLNCTLSIGYGKIVFCESLIGVVTMLKNKESLVLGIIMGSLPLCLVVFFNLVVKVVN